MHFKTFMILTAGVVLCWVLADRVVNLHALFLPKPLDFAATLLGIVGDGELLRNLWPTLWRVAFGIGVALAVGVPAAVLASRSRPVALVLTATLDFLRSIPTPILFPVFIVFVGLGEPSRLVICSYVATPIVFIGTLNGLLPVPGNPARREYFLLNRRRLGWVLRVCLAAWEALPSVVTGLKVAFSTSLVIVTVTEMFFIADRGVGWAAQQAYLGLNLELMYAYIVVIGVIGLAINVAFDAAVNRLKREQGA